MRIVNVQLREQAEAAIKDKVATMSIDEVLSDKQPIIKELTHRLRTVAEGDREDDLELALQQIELERRRVAEELEAVRRETELDRAKAERDKLRASAAAEVEDVGHEARARREERDLALFKRRRESENDLSAQH